jgi:hypothetical protein
MTEPASKEMREPTMAMSDAALSATVSTDKPPLDIWRAMIDAALEQSK